MKYLIIIVLIVIAIRILRGIYRRIRRHIFLLAREAVAVASAHVPAVQPAPNVPENHIPATDDGTLIEYRTESGGNLFRFEAVRIRGQLRFYIRQGMAYRIYGRSDDAHSTHRYTDGRGSWICWDGEEPSNWGQVQGLLKAWCEATERYCFHGITF